MRLRNDSGYPLNAQDLGRVIGPGEEFEHSEYITGCTNLDQPPDGDGQGEPGTEEDSPDDAGSPPPAAGSPPPKVKTRAAAKTGDAA
jgi:hypothetical protein